MSFMVGGRCLLIQGDNPTLDLDPCFVEHATLHVLDLSTSDAAVTPINEDQTRGVNWLLETSVEDEACTTFLSPYDNGTQHSCDFNAGHDEGHLNLQRKR